MPIIDLPANFVYEGRTFYVEPPGANSIPLGDAFALVYTIIDAIYMQGDGTVTVDQNELYSLFANPTRLDPGSGITIPETGNIIIWPPVPNTNIHIQTSTSYFSYFVDYSARDYVPLLSQTNELVIQDEYVNPHEIE
jgi:hypothetical protein